MFKAHFTQIRKQAAINTTSLAELHINANTYIRLFLAGATRAASHA